jgi:hypothetical protein
MSKTLEERVEEFRRLLTPAQIAFFSDPRPRRAHVSRYSGYRTMGAQMALLHRIIAEHKP